MVTEYTYQDFLLGKPYPSKLRAAFVVAESLANYHNAHKPWWKKKASNIFFVPVAKKVIQDLDVRGLILDDSTEAR